MVQSSLKQLVRNTPTLASTLSQDEIHVWGGSIADLLEDVDHWSSLLTETEMKRGNRQFKKNDRTRFISRRVLLRLALARYLDVSPGELSFAQGEFGKPRLDAFRHRSDIRFNLSHSDEMLLFAISRGREVGVDVERVRSLKDMDQLAESVFSDDEKSQFEKVPQADRQQTFFEHWVCKEAVLKALGSGLSISPEKISISIFDGQVSVHSTQELGADPSDIVVELIAPRIGCVGAVASFRATKDLPSFELSDLLSERKPIGIVPRTPK